MADSKSPVHLDVDAANGLSQALDQCTLNTHTRDDSSFATTPCPMRLYTRPELLHLAKSPLVCLPDNMPALKDWFGVENEQALIKKDNEPHSANTGRERRFRRELDDGENATRQSFRGTVTQPSQMGNFKHQSLRSADRELDKERDREGQDRLRHLADKYDRERGIGLTIGSRKDRDQTVIAGSSNRVGNTVQTNGGRRSEPREAAKRKPLEGGDDWRRAADTYRPARDEPNPRRGREDRERPRSRARERSRSTGRSKSRGQRSVSRKPREERDKDRRKDREDVRPAREGDREGDNDPRRWRDDGRRDERLAARRDKDQWDRDRPRDKSPLADDRWNIVDDRESRNKRGGNRERKSGPATEDRKEKDREKEPAWMDTYIPSSAAGILGGKRDDGEIDDFQAFKKGMRAKELGEVTTRATEATAKEESATPSTEKGLDEIQLFKLMMERDKGKKSELPGDSSPLVHLDRPSAVSPTTVHPTAHLASSSPASPNTASSLKNLLHTLVPQLTESAQSRPDANLHDKPEESRFFPKTLATNIVPATNLNTEHSPAAAPYTPPAGSRLLAFATRQNTSESALHVTNNHAGSTNFTSVTTGPDRLPRPLNDGIHERFEVIYPETYVPDPTPSPFANYVFPRDRPPNEDIQQLLAPGQAHQETRSDRREIPHMSDHRDSQFIASNLGSPAVHEDSNAYATGRGSRLAKLRENSSNQGHSNAYLHRTTNDLLNMLDNSMPGAVRHGIDNTSLHQAPPSLAGQMRHNQNHITPSLQANQMHHNPSQHEQLYNNNAPLRPPPSNRMDSLYESRNFVPDDMVPGLRPSLAPRGNDQGSFTSPIDDSVRYMPDRDRNPLLQRGMGTNYQDNLVGSMYANMAPNAAARNHVGLNQTQIPFRGGNSPNQMLNHGQQHQRLPPGLANLGGRPPHEPGAFMGAGMNYGTASHSINGPSQFAQNYAQGSGYAGGPIGRGHPDGPGLLHNPMSGSIERQGSNQLAQLLHLGTGPGIAPAVSHPGFGMQSSNRIPSPGTMRQQQLHLQHQQLQQRLPQQQHQFQAPPPNSNTSDLMALLLGGGGH